MNESRAITGETFLRVDEVVSMLPIGKTSFLESVKSGKFPQPLRLTPRRPVWRKSDIDSLLSAL
jgi:predicted DNA-binding transcriptional regulator AlpA